ncbi:hypothetical protein [Prevotella sp.]|uniref:hypothetical protein n=1 Tax=Prevotella sp. TaxID=59823 RepID=UPI002647B6BE|nr:hypothetical protein [Prevotella sp.]MDN5554380.1 hypothetical protein [Prevotella sp.]
MLSDKHIREALEDVITSKDYIKANDLNGLRLAAFKFLQHLNGDKIFKAEYDSTSKYYVSVNNTFKKIIQKYNMGDMLSALKLLKKYLVDEDGNIKLNTDTLNKDKPLYRMRSQKGYDLYERKELFHIPIDKAQNIPSARYSINGFPCLYLGASLYVCWEETRRTDIDKVNYVKMVPTKQIPFVTTLCPNKFNEKSDVIQFFIFALCTKMADNDSDAFQFQYAFPELLLSILIHSKDEAWGIKYVSARYFGKGGQFSLESLFYNYVIPKRGVIDSSDHLCSELKAAFKVSDVKAFYVSRIYENQVPHLRRTRSNEYENTHFGLLEKELKATRRLEIKKKGKGSKSPKS